MSDFGRYETERRLRGEVDRAGSDAEALLERERVWGQLNRQDIAELTAENERLRDLLATARRGLHDVAHCAGTLPQGVRGDTLLALSRSNPDVQPESEK